MRSKQYPGQGAGWLVWYVIAVIGMTAFALWLNTAHAQAAGRTAVIKFTGPTHYTDGSEIAAGTPISYRVYQGLKGQAKTQVATITETATTISTGLAGGAEYCWHVAVVINDMESVPSNEACKAFPFPTPQTITITVE